MEVDIVLWLPGDYIGTAIWVHDDRLGDSFQNRVVISEDKKQLIN